MGDEKMLDGQELYFGPAPTTPMPYTHPLDQAPAADPALDALALFEKGPADFEPNMGKRLRLVATIRDALADRITPEMAVLADALIRIGYPNALDETDYKLLAKLGQIAGDR